MLADDADPTVRAQLAFTLGESNEAGLAFARMLNLLTKHAEDRQIRSAIVSGLHRREFDFLKSILDYDPWREESRARTDAINVVVQAILAGQTKPIVRHLLELACVQHDADTAWRTRIILGRIADVQKLDSNAPRFIVTDREPEGWSDFVESEDDLAQRAREIDAYLYWEGRPGMSGPSGPRALTSEEVVRFERGRRLYTDLCMSCHQSHGRGQAGTAPALADNDDVNRKSPGRAIRVMLHGMSGPLEVQGVQFNASMPKSPAPSDLDIAAILTYVRRAWGNTADPVSPEDVARVREETRGRRQPWTMGELHAVE